jgi:hypothetical protein
MNDFEKMRSLLAPLDQAILDPSRTRAARAERAMLRELAVQKPAFDRFVGFARPVLLTSSVVVYLAWAFVTSSALH